jgi:hypothetical protein
MNSARHWLLTFLLNSIWQIPLVAFAAVVAARLMAPASWRARHLLFIAALLLAILLPTWSASTSTVRPGESIAVTILPGFQDDAATKQTAHRSLIPHRYSSSLHLAPAISRTAAFVYFAFLLIQAGLLLWKWRATRTLLRRATARALPRDLSAQWQRWLQSFNIPNVNLLVSDRISGPVT